MNREALARLSKDELIDLLLAQEARLAELERRLGLDSRNSGKPPSSDGLKKPPRTRSLREMSGRKPGGQKGHKGETLRQAAAPDAAVDHFPETCRRCGSALTPAMATGYGARQVFDLPAPRPVVVTEHRAHHCRCGTCGAETGAWFPKGVTAPVQYGARIMAMYLLHFQLLSEDRLAELMADLFGVAPATIARMRRGCAARFRGFVDAIRERVKAAAGPEVAVAGMVRGAVAWVIGGRS